MNDTIHMQKKPHWVQEALFLLLDWLLWKQVHPEGPVERWVEQPLFEDGPNPFLRIPNWKTI